MRDGPEEVTDEHRVVLECRLEIDGAIVERRGRNKPADELDVAGTDQSLRFEKAKAKRLCISSTHRRRRSEYSAARARVSVCTGPHDCKRDRDDARSDHDAHKLRKTTRKALSSVPVAQVLTTSVRLTTHHVKPTHR